MIRRILLVCGLLMLATPAVLGQGRVWVLPVVQLDNAGAFTEEVTGGYVGAYPKSGHYWWANTNDGVIRGWWKFQAGNDSLGGGPNFVPGAGLTTDDPPAEPRLYFIRTWIPPAHSSTYSIIEADILGPNVSESLLDPRIPWNGAFGQNHQWLQRSPSNQGTWRATGPGPQAPVATQNGISVYSSPCSASGTGFTMWLRKGDWLYVKWNFDGNIKSIGFSAVEITEANAIPPGLPAVATCGDPVCRGPIDLRCMGNADPLYGVTASNWWDSPDREPFAEDQSDPKAYMVAKGDSTFAAEGYRRPCTSAATLSPGLPTNGSYTAHLATGDVQFQLRYDGFNSLKWDAGDTNPASSFVNTRVFTLNNMSYSEFAARPYNKLYLLSTKNGNNGQLNVQLIYTDTSSTTTSVSLYDWFPGNASDSDPTSIAVGVSGTLKTLGGTGFKRFKADGVSMDGGNTNGAFFFVHPIDVDPSKYLSQVALSVSADGRGFGGNIVVFAATLASSTCVFDVAGGSPDNSVDMNDFGYFQRCYTGPLQLLDPLNCRCMDVTRDNHVDNFDFAYFVNCATGAAIGPPPANCDVAP